MSMKRLVRARRAVPRRSRSPRLSSWHRDTRFEDDDRIPLGDDQIPFMEADESFRDPDEDPPTAPEFEAAEQWPYAWDQKDPVPGAMH